MPDNCVAFLSYAWCYSSNASPHHLQNTFHPEMPIAHSAGKAPVGLLHCLSCVSSSWRILTASKVSVMIVFFPDVSQGSSSVHCFSNPSYHTLSCGVTSRFFPRNLDGNSSSKVDMIPPPTAALFLSVQGNKAKQCLLDPDTVALMDTAGSAFPVCVCVISVPRDGSVSPWSISFAA